MFLKHYAPNRYEPRIEVVKMGVRPGGGLGRGMRPRIRYCRGGGGSVGGGGGGGSGLM